MGFDITGLGSVFQFGTAILDKIFPNKDEADKAKFAMLQLQQAGEFKQLDQQFQLSLEQVKVNAVEAASASMFVAGWRPAAGWTCVAGMAYMFFLRPLISWVATVTGLGSVPPVIDTTVLFELLVAMLGIGTLRTYEKVQGVSK